MTRHPEANERSREETEMPVPFDVAVPDDPRPHRRDRDVRLAGHGRPARSRRVWGLALVAVAGTLSMSLSRAAAVAGGRDHPRDADVTFTKWITSLPTDPSTLAGVHMAGVVGGDVGRGRYVGRVISDNTTSKPGFWLGHARYGFHGRRHTFVANVHITENDTTVPITATIRGVVRKGWLKGARVTGRYRQWDSCPIPTPGNVLGERLLPGARSTSNAETGTSTEPRAWTAPGCPRAGRHLPSSHTTGGASRVSAACHSEIHRLEAGRGLGRAAAHRRERRRALCSANGSRYVPGLNHSGASASIRGRDRRGRRARRAALPARRTRTARTRPARSESTSRRSSARSLRASASRSLRRGRAPCRPRIPIASASRLSRSGLGGVSALRARNCARRAARRHSPCTQWSRLLRTARSAADF